MNQPASGTELSVPIRQRNITLWPASEDRSARLAP